MQALELFQPQPARDPTVSPNTVLHVIVQKSAGHHSTDCCRERRKVGQFFYGLDTTLPAAALACQALNMQCIVYELDHLFNLVFKISKMRHNAKLRVSTEHLQGPLIMFLCLLAIMVPPWVIGAWTPLVMASMCTSRQLYHKVITGNQVFFRKSGPSRKAQCLLPLFIRQVQLRAQRTSIQNENRALRGVQLCNIEKGCLLGQLKIDEDTLHSNLSLRAHPFRLEAITVRQQMCCHLWYGEHLKAACSKTVSEKCQCR
mmetsp:Transcript_14154/g.24947  ORF Transcript_14154/g.24947 Transcript_14154/m.24947 type:complete len:258 (-) Transcript_14154:161-934(-)